MNIILVRHTETEANQKKVYGGIKDYKLSLKGYNDIKIVSKEIITRYKETFENGGVIWTSPLSRCSQLAYYINNELKSTVEKHDYIKELNFGIFEGLTNKEIKTIYNKEYERWSKDYIDYQIPEGESVFQCHERVKRFLDKIITNNKDTIIVTHGGIIKHMIVELLNLTLNDYWKFYCGNGAIIEISYENGFGYIKNLIHIV